MTGATPPGGVWVHVYEEDQGGGAVFRPQESDIPLSRRPRLAFELRPGGTATIWTGGADDRPSAVPARWTREGSVLVVRDGGGDERLRIVEQSPDKLFVTLR